MQSFECNNQKLVEIVSKFALKISISLQCKSFKSPQILNFKKY